MLHLAPLAPRYRGELDFKVPQFWGTLEAIESKFFIQKKGT